jgi:hypothetical protein
MKSGIYIRCIFWVIFGAGLIIGLGLQTIRGGPEAPVWALPLGNAILGATLAFVGANLLIGLLTDEKFIFRLRSRRNDRRKIKLQERILWFLIGGLVTLSGSIMLLISVYEVLTAIL